MKIISKYKDYYDYLVGQFGEDPKLILDRRTWNRSYHIEDDMYFKIIIGDKQIDGVYKNNQYYYGHELDQFNVDNKKRYFHIKHNQETQIRYETRQWRHLSAYVILNKEVININKRESAAAIYLQLEDQSKCYDYPRLSEFRIQSYMPPKDIWIELSSYLSKQIIEPIVPVGDDKIRLISAGFDLKTSFRH